ncbi:MAG TPA: hypothetical protein VNG34_01135 [Actinomycetota bacterium]|nr:hypothetical protein [Actinomycetota bacterium]
MMVPVGVHIVTDERDEGVDDHESGADVAGVSLDHVDVGRKFDRISPNVDLVEPCRRSL